MDMLDDISKELPTNGLKVADLINAFNVRLGIVSNALAQLDRKQDSIESKLEKKLEDQDRKLDEVIAVQARAPTRADMAELQKEQMRRETYEVAHQAVVQQVANAVADVVNLKATQQAAEVRVQELQRAADRLHGDQNLALKGLQDRSQVIENTMHDMRDAMANVPPTRRARMALWLTAAGIGVALLCSGLGTVISAAELVLRATGH